VACGDNAARLDRREQKNQWGHGEGEDRADREQIGVGEDARLLKQRLVRPSAGGLRDSRRRRAANHEGIAHALQRVVVGLEEGRQVAHEVRLSYLRARHHQGCR
jgi:hypothetical protein